MPRPFLQGLLEGVDLKENINYIEEMINRQVRTKDD